MKKIEIENIEESIAAAIQEHITTPGLVAEWLVDESGENECEMVDGVIVLRPRNWHADDGNAEVGYNCESGEEAAKKYVDDGNWGDRSETSWIRVHVWREGVDAQGEIVRVDESTETITLEAEEPQCTEDEHDWQSPIAIVGGIEENPGVYGHGGGVTITEVCMHCGCKRVRDTWAQDPQTGEQGLESVEYESGRYANEVAAIKEEAANE